MDFSFFLLFCNNRYPVLDNISCKVCRHYFNNNIIELKLVLHILYQKYNNHSFNNSFVYTSLRFILRVKYVEQWSEFCLFFALYDIL